MVSETRDRITQCSTGLLYEKSITDGEIVLLVDLTIQMQHGDFEE